MLYPELPSASYVDVPASQRRAPGTADLLDYEVLLTDAVIAHKAGGMIAAFDFTGLPHDATEEADLDIAEDQLLHAFSDLGSGWVIHVDYQRYHASAYPCQSVATDPAARAIEARRRETFLHRPQFASQSTIWFTYFPERSARSFFTKPAQDLHGFEAALDTFVGKVAHAAQLRRLQDDTLVAHLRSTLRLEAPRPITLHSDAFLDSALAPGLERLPSGVLRVGDIFTVPLRLTSLPKKLFSGALRNVATCRMPLRLTTRMVMLSPWHADEAIDRKRRRRESHQFSWRSLVRTFTQGKEGAQHAARLDRAEGIAADEQVQNARLRETNRALEASYGDRSFVYFAPSLFALGTSEAQANDHADQLLSLLRGARLDAERDRYNEVQSYLGATPGNAWANQRRYFQPLRAALALQVLTSAWQGHREPPHPLLRGCGPLAVVRSDAGEAFFLNLHPGNIHTGNTHTGNTGLSDLGHTLVLGPSGSGKSVLLNFLAASARRYPGAKVISLDIDRSQMIHCLAANGSFYDLGDDPDTGLRSGLDAGINDRPLSFAPLFLLRDKTPEARAATLTWLMTLWDASHQEPLPDADAEHLADGLEEVANLDPDLHTLEVLATKVQSPRLRTLLARYCQHGEHAGLFAGNHAGLFAGNHNGIAAETASRYPCYSVIELRGLLGRRPEARVPAFVHLQQLITHALDGRPAWVLIDEGSHFLDDPILAASLRDWLVTLRKRNASVVFATQSLAHFRDPALRQIFSESCPTKIYLPNAAAAGHQEVRQAYEAAGLSPRQITRIAEAHPKKHYLLVQPDGERLIDLALTPEELAILGTSAPQAIERVMALREVDPKGWLDRWIAESTAATTSTSSAPRRPTDDS